MGLELSHLTVKGRLGALATPEVHGMGPSWVEGRATRAASPGVLGARVPHSSTLTVQEPVRKEQLAVTAREPHSDLKEDPGFKSPF